MFFKLYKFLRYFSVLVLMLFFVSSCNGSSDKTKENVDAIFKAFDGLNIYTLDLEKMVELGVEAIPYLAKKLDSADQSDRWAAVMSLSAIGRHLGVKEKVLPDLLRALEDDDITVRVMAAELVVAFGEKDGIPVLIAALDSNEKLRPSEPPTPVTSKSLEVLKLYTTQTFFERQEWQNWWDQNKDSLVWVNDEEKFK